MIALEPEAAAMYCRVLPIEKLLFSTGYKLGVLRPGAKYMVVDIGGKMW